MTRISTPLVTQIAIVASVLARADTLHAEKLQFNLQRRDPQTNEVVITRERVESKHVGVVRTAGILSVAAAWSRLARR